MRNPPILFFPDLLEGCYTVSVHAVLLYMYCTVLCILLRIFDSSQRRIYVISELRIDVLVQTTFQTIRRKTSDRMQNSILLRPFTDSVSPNPA